MPSPQDPPRCSLYLITPPLSTLEAGTLAKIFAEILAAAPVASALLRFARGSEQEAGAIAPPFLSAAMAANCALLFESDARMAARLGADGVHVSGAGEDLVAAIKSLKPEGIVGAGSLRTRDDAMTAGEKGVDYVRFGERRGVTSAMALEPLIERVGWWAEIFETPCVAYAETIAAAARLARAGADFVALDEAIWGAASPATAAREAHALLASVGAST
jgi:thiamine-phosphate pyrophosphorylase